MDSRDIHNLSGKLLQLLDAEKADDDTKEAALRVAAETLAQVVSMRNRAFMMANILRPK